MVIFPDQPNMTTVGQKWCEFRVELFVCKCSRILHKIASGAELTPFHFKYISVTGHTNAILTGPDDYFAPLMAVTVLSFVESLI